MPILFYVALGGVAAVVAAPLLVRLFLPHLARRR